ncbi:MAG: hypothetical protein N2318_13145 [Meiothermus sp.]|nr:hypothetical protein [Meiothermus sp.]
MKKLIALVVAAFMLAGCANFVTDFGIPSVVIAGAGSEDRSIRDANGNVTRVAFVVKYTIRTLPGSPLGVISQLNLVGGGTLSGGEVLSCAPETPVDGCPVIRGEITFNQFPATGSIRVESYDANSANGGGRTVFLPRPVTLY